MPVFIFFVFDRNSTIFINVDIMKYSEVHRRLKKAGCYQVGSNRHPKWFSPITGKTFDTSHHESEEAANLIPNKR